MDKYEISSSLREDKEFEHFVMMLPEMFGGQGETLFQGRNHLKVAEVAGRRIVIKQFHRPNIFQRLDYTFIRQSKAKRAYQNANRLRIREIATPENLAYIEEYRHYIYQRGYCLTIFDDGTPLNLLLDDDPDIASMFACFVAKMHEKGVVHCDLNPSNVLCHRDDKHSRYEFSLIDINRMRFYAKPVPLNQCRRDFLTFSAPSASYEHFVKCYLQARNVYCANTLQLILQIKRRHDAKRHPIKKFFKRFDKMYYKLLG